jgi:hypothetical protein
VIEAAVWDHGQPRVDHLTRLGAPVAIGLDETSFLAATATHPTLLVTGILDLDTGRLVDVLPARSARAVTDWLAAKPAPWRAGIRHVVIDPYQPYATAVAAQLPDARSWSTASPWSGWPTPRWMRSAAGCSTPPWVTVATRVIRCIGSAVGS